LTLSITNYELLIGDFASELKRQKTLLRLMSFEGQLTAALQDKRPAALKDFNLSLNCLRHQIPSGPNGEAPNSSL
jgi:hypothetical protein